MKKDTSYEVREIDNLKDMLEQSAKLFSTKNAFWLKGEDENYTGITYKKLSEDVSALGTAMINMGLKGKKVAVIGENRYEWCVTYLATVNGTGVIVPLDKELPENEIKNLLMRSEASAIIFSEKYRDIINNIKEDLPSLKYLIDMDGDANESNNGDFISLCRLIEKGEKLISDGNTEFTDVPINNEEMSILLFTSGTTDLAKGVMLSHKNICSDLMGVCALIEIKENDSVLSVLPIHHTYECTCGFLLMLYKGVTISFSQGLKYVAQNLKEVKPTVLLAVPLMYENMYSKIWSQARKSGLERKLRLGLKISNFLNKYFKIDIRKKLFASVMDAFGGRIRIGISGGAAINPDILKSLRQLGIPVIQGYGLTECSPIVTANTDEDYKDASIGKALPNVKVKINEPDKNGIGEIIVKGDIVMLGYFNNEEATNKAIKNGWFYTGDLGYKGKDDFFYITGRKKNVIVTKNGKNIFPEEVESYINKSHYVMESIVFGKNILEERETLVCAVVVPNIENIRLHLGKEDVAIEEIRSLIGAEIKKVNKSMPLYKMVREFEIREEEFEKTTTKKIKRTANI